MGGRGRGRGSRRRRIGICTGQVCDCILHISGVWALHEQDRTAFAKDVHAKHQEIIPLHKPPSPRTVPEHGITKCRVEPRHLIS